ncbi:TetR/AcrR family transcriptional regulator [Nocardia sp. XZ_19_231]|uniref:TetR/AcrR family transcriptional regulator n=1 Tax=Nocardia sp. XZ_19_231 TaxID=2769252 RepID=UPI00188F4F77|nr:TetR/AcrR family transcriptional regulator [Nocardia sp. XZ_19_231]
MYEKSRMTFWMFGMTNRTLSGMTSPYAPEEPREEESLAARAARRRAGNRQAAAEDEVRRMLDAGLALMSADPTAEPRVAQIVTRAKVSNDAFYRAFRGKDDLMAAIADDGARRLLDQLRQRCAERSGAIERIRGCVDTVFWQAIDPEVAATTRAVLRHTSRGAMSQSGGVRLRAQIADLLTGPLGELGSADPARDALVASCAMFATMEQFLWSESIPSAADAEHLLQWIVRPQPAAHLAE